MGRKKSRSVEVEINELGKFLFAFYFKKRGVIKMGKREVTYFQKLPKLTIREKALLEGRKDGIEESERKCKRDCIPRKEHEAFRKRVVEVLEMHYNDVKENPESNRPETISRVWSIILDCGFEKEVGK